MLRFLKVSEGKALQVFPVSASTKRGATVVIDVANGNIDKATSVSDFGLVDIAESFDGINSVINPNDTSFETIASASKALFVPTLVGEKYATTELTPTGLEVGNLIKSAAGKFVTAENEEVCEWVYQGLYSDPTGLTMYAVGKTLPKTAVTYTVSYDKNNGGATGTMTDASSPYQTGNTVTTKVNTFVAPADYEFDCWSTATTKTGEGVVNYDEGDTFTIAANTTLYAIWKELPEYTVTYDKNSDDATGTLTDENSPYRVGDEVTILASTLTPPDDYRFKCWCTETTEAEGSISFDPDDTFEIEEDTTLYAIWEELNEYTITYDKNDAGASGTCADPSSPYHSDDTVTIIACTFVAPADYEFDCWSTATTKTGEGVLNFDAAEELQLLDDLTLYAIWKELPEYAVTFDKNSAGATGEMTDASSPYHEGDTVTVPACTFTPEALYEFDCWSTATTKTGEGVINYAELATFEIAANTTLYAIWKLA